MESFGLFAASYYFFATVHRKLTIGFAFTFFIKNVMKKQIKRPKTIKNKIINPLEFHQIDFDWAFNTKWFTF